MKLNLLIAAIATASLGLAQPSHGQTTMDNPWGSTVDMTLDSGFRASAGERSAVVFTELVELRDAAWLRLYFRQIALDGDSRIRFTSMLDGEVQEFDAAAARQWNNTTAYFNGDAVLVELIAAPGTRHNRVELQHVAAAHAQGEVGGLCGVHGEDNRVPSDEIWAGRLGPGGCTASVFSTDSCMVSAGHCENSHTIVQFNVPESLPNCDIQHPPVSDQFPIGESIKRNNGIGGDWWVLTTGTNDLGETIYERYGELRPIAKEPVEKGDVVELWSYGITVDCTLTQTQQYSTGEIAEVYIWYLHTADFTSGSSGCALTHNGEIVGIGTHCGSNTNLGNRIDDDVLLAAIDELCSEPMPGDLNDDGSVNVSDMLILLGAWGDCPNTGSCPADLNADATVNVSDLLILLSNWS